MKRSLLVLLLTAITIFTFVNGSQAQYTIINLTNTIDSSELSPQINDNGWVVWWGGGIWLYDGVSTPQLVANGASSQINDNGDVVWMGYDGSDSEIYLYDGTSTTNISNNDYDGFSPQINDNGHVVWEGCDRADCGMGYGDDYFEIFLYDGTSTTNISNNDYEDHDPQINGNGYVVWHGCDTADCSGSGDGDWEIFLYDGSSTTQLTNNAYGDYFPQINDNGWVVWWGFGGIWLYDGVSTTQLAAFGRNCQINNNGYVVWEGPGGSSYEIFLYDGTSTTQLTNNAYADYFPQINDNGDVVWQGCDEGYGVGCDGGDWEIFLYDGTLPPTQLTNNAYGDLVPQVNDNGYVVWWGKDVRDWDDEIFLGVPCSYDNDYDDDGYVSASCGGVDCSDSRPFVFPGAPELCDGIDNQCSGDAGYGQVDEGCSSCTGSAVASTVGPNTVYGASDLGKHLAYLLLPVGAVIVLRLWRRKK